MDAQVSENRLNDWLIPALLIVFTLVFRLLTLQMINVGPDEIDYWHAAKILFSGVPYGPLDHRNVRWAIIVPTFLLQRMLGTHPIVYAVGPVLLSCVQSWFTYDLGKRLFSRGAGVLAVVMLTAFPYMIRSGSQIRPGIFSVTYLLAAFWVITRNESTLQNTKGFSRPVAIAAFLVFCAYQTKITNLYFLPFFATTLYTAAKRRLRPAIVFLALLAAGYLAEVLLYLVAAGEPLGQLSIISRTHLTSTYSAKFAGSSFLGLFERYSTANFPLFWRLAFLLYVLAAGYLAYRWKGTQRSLWNRLFLLLVVSFSFFLTFALKSVHPLIPLEPHQNRYFTPILPWMFLIIAAGVIELAGPAARLFARLAERWTRVGLLLSGILLAVAGASYFHLYPESLAEYAPSLADPGDHVIALYVRYARLVDDAWGQGLPVLSVNLAARDSDKAIDTVNRVFLRWNEREAAREKPRVVAGDYGYQFIAREGITYDGQYLAAIEGTPILAVDRFPFRVWKSTLEEERARFR